MGEGDPVDYGTQLVCEVGASRRFESGRYVALTIKAPGSDEAERLFNDLAEAATNLSGRPYDAETAAQRTDARVYRGVWRITIGRLRIQVMTP